MHPSPCMRAAMNAVRSLSHHRSWLSCAASQRTPHVCRLGQDIVWLLATIATSSPTTAKFTFVNKLQGDDFVRGPRGALHRRRRLRRRPRLRLSRPTTSTFSTATTFATTATRTPLPQTFRRPRRDFAQEGRRRGLRGTLIRRRRLLRRPRLRLNRPTTSYDFCDNRDANSSAAPLNDDL